jgi:hypothetical protein
MNANLLKLLGLLGAGGMVAGPLSKLGSKDKDPEMMDANSEEAKMMQAERQAMRDYEASPARQDRLAAMGQEEVDQEDMDQLDEDRKFQLEALKRLRGR